MTTWNEHERDKCWEEVKSILTGDEDIGVQTTFVSENQGYVPVHRGINFPSSGSESGGTGCVRMAHSDTKMPRIRPTWYSGETKGKRNSCREMRWSLQKSEWKSNSEHRAFDWRCNSSSMSTAVTLRLRSLVLKPSFVVDDMKAMYRLDGIITVVDAAHVECISTKRS